MARQSASERALGLLVHLSGEIIETRRWAANAAYGRAVRGSEARRPVHASDPTGGIATGKPQESLRAALRELDDEMLEGVKRIVRAYDRVSKTFNRTDPRHEIMRDRFPSEPRSEILKAQEAKARRDARGDGYGVS